MSIYGVEGSQLMYPLSVLSEIAEGNEEAASPVKVDTTEDNLENDEVLQRKEWRRKKIVTELFETEKTYLHHLEVTQKVIYTCIYEPYYAKNA